MIKQCAAFLLLCLPLTALAGDTGWITISPNSVQIVSDGNPRANVWVNVIQGNCYNGSTENAMPAVLMMDGTNTLANQMYAMLLTAKATGQTVFIQTAGCTSNNYPKIFSIHFGA